MFGTRNLNEFDCAGGFCGHDDFPLNQKPRNNKFEITIHTNGSRWGPGYFGSDPFGSNPFRSRSSGLLGGFGSGDEAERFTRDGHVYYSMPRDTEYNVCMHNRSSDRVNAVLTIDGEEMGKWRINAHSEITVERPAHNQRKFTYVKENSWQEVMGGIRQGSSDNGLIEVRFIPEARVYDAINFDDIPDPSMRSFNYSSENSLGTRAQSYNESLSFSNKSTNDAGFAVGGTVLGDDSSQRFGDASRIIEDEQRAITKRVRLVVDKGVRKPYASIRSRGTVFDEGIYDDMVPPQIGRGIRSRNRRAKARTTIYGDSPWFNGTDDIDFRSSRGRRNLNNFV